MPAIKIHHTPTDTKSAWDGPGEVAKAPAEEATLRYMHAWEESGADPNAKGSWKFPHHDAGTDTAANIHGVDNALARLSQADIPEGDRAGVKAHLDAHRKDAGLDVSEDSTPHTRHEPIRCIEGTMQPHQPFWRFRNSAESETGEPEMELYGFLSEYSWYEDDITPKMFKTDLYNYGNKGPVTIRMNSGGGDVVAASVMKSILTDYPGRVTVKIDGLCASAATIVAMAGDVVKMQESAYFMIHDPSMAFFLTSLNISDLQGILDQLKTCKDGILDAYERKTGLNRDKLGKMMTNETWMTANEACGMGFVDQIVFPAKQKPEQAAQNIPAAITNMVDGRMFNLYRNVPAALTRQPVSDPALERFRAEVKICLNGGNAK